MIGSIDWQLEKVKEQLKETRLDLAKTMDELDKKKEALLAEKTKAVEHVKQVEAAAKEKLELTKQRNEKAERETHVLNKLQMTYKKKVVNYESQAQAPAAIIIRLRQEKQEAHARAQLGVDRIRHIISAWRDPSREKYQRIFGKGMEGVVATSSEATNTSGRCGKPEKGR